LPQRLHWFYWESYSTWLSGFALFVALYLFQANTYLIDPRVQAWSPGVAVAIALSFFVVGWLVYDCYADWWGWAMMRPSNCLKSVYWAC
jgi:uncharacterized membrane protein